MSNAKAEGIEAEGLSPGEPNSQPECVLVCQHRSCAQRGAVEVLAQFQTLLHAGVSAKSSDCMGQCSIGVTVRILPDNIWYCQVRPEHVSQIVIEHLQGDRPIQRLLHPRFHPAASMTASSSTRQP